MELSHKLGKEISTQETYFPIDVMANILNRLPSTSISRFQIVSKYWYHVIHVSIILNPRPKSSLMSVELCTNVDSRKLTFFNFDKEGRTKKSVRKINLGCRIHYNFSNMVNGMVCVFGESITFHLINLTTLKTSKYLKRRIQGTALWYDSISLGFDPSTGLYKLVRIYSHFLSASYQCEILESGVWFEGYWKTIGEIPHEVDLDNLVFLNGAIYWFRKLESFMSGKSHSFDLLKLDMKEEKFRNVAPVLTDEFHNHDRAVCSSCDNFTLTEDNGKLYVLRYCSERQYLDGWRLNESKRQCVWNVACRVNFASILGNEPRCLMGKYTHPYVVGIADGKVLMRSRRYNEGVYIYDLLRKKLSKHWDIDCGRFVCNHEKRRMLFYCVG